MDTKVDLHRFKEQIDELQEQLKTNPPKPGGILFYGSSTMANWREDDLCYRQMAPLPVTNTGFGGSTAEEALYFYHQLVKPAQPAILVYYEGANDLSNSYTVDEVLETTHRLFEWARQDFPGIRFVIIPIKLCPALEHIQKEAEACNLQFCNYAEAYNDTCIIDVSPLFYDENGDWRRDIYVEDMLHHNLKGYQELTALLKPTLMAMTGQGK